MINEKLNPPYIPKIALSLLFATGETPRFKTTLVKPLCELIHQSVPPKTKEKSMWAYRAYTAWADWSMSGSSTSSTQQEYHGIIGTKKLLEMSDPEVDIVLAAFVQQARNQKGERYPPKTLYELITSLQKHMELNNTKRLLIDCQHFPNLYYALDVQMKESTGLGLGMNTKQSDTIQQSQEDVLWEKKILDPDTPKGLQRALFYMIGVHFALRGGKAHRDLTTANFTVIEEQSGHSYLQYVEKVGKTRQGGIKDMKYKHHNARAYANDNNPKRCPVIVYKKYVSLCPLEGLTKALYLQALKTPKPNQWYSRVPVGHNTFSS